MRRLLPLLALAGGLLWSCDSGNPVEPSASPVSSANQQFKVSISVDPPQLVAGSGVPGTVNITVLTSQDFAVTDGTRVTVSTDLGNFGTNSDGEIKVVTLSSLDGVVSTSLFPSDNIETATLEAVVGQSLVGASVPFVESTSPALFVTEVSPNVGSAFGGEEVSVLGGGFVQPLTVNFGDGVARVIEVVSRQRLRVETPPLAGGLAAGTTMAVDVTVNAGLDQETPQSATLTGGFIYSEDAAVPVFITEVVPNIGTADGGERVTIRGGGFTAPVQVDFGGKAGESPAVVSSSEIRVTVPAPATVPAPGETVVVDVTVNSGLNGETAQTAVLSGGYTYSGDTPVFITAIEPSSGGPDGGERVTVRGGGFTSPASVDFGGQAGINPQVTSSSQIRVTIPAPATAVGAGETLSVDVTVTSGLNQASPQMATLTGGYVYIGEAAVVVSAISPTSGPYEGGTEVTVTGQGFESPVAVELAGIRQSSEEFVDSTTVRFTTVGIGIESCPASGQVAQTGVTVTNTGSGLSATGDLTFTYTVPLPRVTRVAPTFGPQLGNSLISLEGSGFEDPVRVAFVTSDGSEFNAAVRSTSDSRVQVTSPRLPDSAFSEVDCTTEDDVAGKRYVQLTVSVMITNQGTACTDTFANAFTYNPTDTSCRPTSGGGG